jgi:hypothetical protein
MQLDSGFVLARQGVDGFSRAFSLVFPRNPLRTSHEGVHASTTFIKDLE